jgi:hypothetical protein
MHCRDIGRLGRSDQTAHAEADASACSASPVARSAGKKDSIAISDRVTSTGVPNTVVVEMNDNIPTWLSICIGTRIEDEGSGRLLLAGAG